MTKNGRFPTLHVLSVLWPGCGGDLPPGELCGQGGWKSSFVKNGESLSKIGCCGTKYNVLNISQYIISFFKTHLIPSIFCCCYLFGGAETLLKMWCFKCAPFKKVIQTLNVSTSLTHFPPFHGPCFTVGFVGPFLSGAIQQSPLSNSRLGKFFDVFFCVSLNQASRCLITNIFDTFDKWWIWPNCSEDLRGVNFFCVA